MGKQLNDDSFFMNTIFTKEETKYLNDNISNINNFNEKIKLILNLDSQKGEKMDLMIEFYNSAMKYSKTQNLSIEQMSTFFSMINYIFEKSFLNKLSPNESYSLFRKIMSKHCLESPPFSIGIFTQNEAYAIVKFMRNSLYRHYTMYEISLNKFDDYNIYQYKKKDDQLGIIQDLSEGIVVDPESVSLLNKYFQQNEQLKDNIDEQQEKPVVVQEIQQEIIQNEQQKNTTKMVVNRLEKFKQNNKNKLDPRALFEKLQVQ